MKSKREELKKEFPRGTRVRTTKVAHDMGLFPPPRQQREGTVTGWGTGRTPCIRVRCDGNKYPESFHHTFWEPILDTMSKPHIIIEMPLERGQEINTDPERAAKIAEHLAALSRLYGPGTRVTHTGPAAEGRMLARYVHTEAGTPEADVNAIAENIIAATELTRDDVKAAFEKDAWGEWPEHALEREEWKLEVESGDTQLGYWQWVEARLEQREFEQQHSRT